MNNPQDVHAPEPPSAAVPKKRKPRGLRWQARLVTRFVRPMLRTLAMLRIANTKVINRPTKLIKGRGVIIAPKHLSDIDHFYIGGALRRVAVFVSKAEVRSWPIAGLFLRTMGTIFVDRNDPASKAAVPELFGEVVEHGGAGIMYPEGTTVVGYPHKEGVPAVGDLKTGVARTALATNTCILLVGLAGPEKVLPSRKYPGLSLRAPVVVNFDDKLLDPAEVRKEVAPDNPNHPTDAQFREMVRRLTERMHEDLTQLTVEAVEIAAARTKKKH